MTCFGALASSLNLESGMDRVVLFCSGMFLSTVLLWCVVEYSSALVCCRVQSCSGVFLSTVQYSREI